MTEIDKDALIAQLQAENELLREKLDPDQLELLLGPDTPKKALRRRARRRRTGG